MTIDSSIIIRRYWEYIALLDEEKSLLIMLIASPAEDFEDQLQITKWKQRVWEIESEILAKRQYIAAYEERIKQAENKP